MNNAIRTILLVLSGLVALVMSIGECVTDAAGATMCKASWLTPQMTGYLVAGLSLVGLVIKALRPGGILAGLFGETAVVSSSGAVGTVTPSQVATGPK